MVGIYNDVIKTATRADSAQNRYDAQNRGAKQKAVEAPAGFFRRFRSIRLSIFG